MDFISKDIAQYAEKYTSKETALLADVNRDTHLNVLMPRMLSGHLQGRFLSMISCLTRPKYILEIGTYTGYSALCLAEGLQDNGELHTLEKNEELESRISKTFGASDKAGQMHLHIGDARQIIPSLKQAFDLVFIDADKVSYSDYYDLIIDQMPSNGVILVDNVLWSGKVLTENSRNDADSKALHLFNEKIEQDSRVENILIPIRDGIMMIRKK